MVKKIHAVFPIFLKRSTWPGTEVCSINYLLLVYLVLCFVGFLHIYHLVNNGFYMLVPRHLGHLLTLVYHRDLFQDLFSSSFISTTSQLASMPISAYLLTTLVYTSVLTTQILLAPYSTSLSRQSTPGPRYCLHRTQHRSPDSLLLVPDTACTVLNIALQTVYSWSQTWPVSFNSVKSQSMLFSRKLNKPAHAQLHMNNIEIDTSNLINILAKRGNALVSEISPQPPLSTQKKCICLLFDHFQSTAT